MLPKKPKKVRDNIEAINKGKKEKDSQRSEQAMKIKASILRKYDTLRQRRKGLAVVNVVDGVCQGCFMAIPPQLFNRLLRGDELFDCPTCQRIIHYRPAGRREKLVLYLFPFFFRLFQLHYQLERVHDRSGFLPERKVRTLQGRMVRNANAGRPGESATENRPPDSIR